MSLWKTLPNFFFPFFILSILGSSDRVKRKCGGTETARLGEHRNIRELEGVAAEQPVNEGMKLLANEEFEKESGGYRSDSEQAEPEKLEVIDGTPKKTHNKKRKAAKKLNRSRYVKENSLSFSINQ